MAAISDFLENRLLNHSLGTTAYAMPTSIHVALFTTNPTDAGTGNEVTTAAYPGYSRKVCTFAAATNGSTSNSGALQWDYNGASNLTVTHIALYSAATGGDFLWHGQLTASKTLSNGDIFRIDAGSLALSLD